MTFSIATIVNKQTSRKNQWEVSYLVKWKSSLVKKQTRKMLPSWNDIPVSGSERKNGETHIPETRRSRYRIWAAIANGIQTTARKCPLMYVSSLSPPSLLSYSLPFLFVPSVKIVKASPVLTTAPGRRSAISGWRKSSPTTGKRSDTLSAQDVFFLSVFLWLFVMV